MLLSVIIPAFNEERYLGETLANLIKSLDEIKNAAFSWEIIVCDNNSSDGTREIADRMGAKVVFESHNQIGRARNRGASIAHGDWFLFLDADSYPPPGLMTDIVLLMMSSEYVGSGSTVNVIGGTIFNKLRIERLNPFFRLLKISGGAYLLCRAKAFQEIGRFSQDLYAFEEIDFVIRLKSYGRLRNQKFIVNHHHPVITSGRKGEYRFSAIGTIFFSNFLAIILFGLHYLLPQAV